MTQAANTFAQRSDQYAQARPRYPRALFDWIIAHCPARGAAWDCATGNGQAAVDLAPYFLQVQATDVSAEQVAQGLPAPNVIYSAQPAEQTGFAKSSFDLVTVAQALHWFDYARFWPEVQRVTRPGALFCAWGYAWFECEQEVLDTFVTPCRALLEPHWAANNRILWDGYRDADIALPLARLPVPPLQVEERWTIAQLIEYMQTWSAWKRAQEDTRKARALAGLVEAAQARFGGAGALEITMPLAIVAGHLHI
jgi:SAM-dependent methyltransferase